MSRPRISDKAQEEIEEILAYLGQFSSTYADNLADKFTEIFN